MCDGDIQVFRQPEERIVEQLKQQEFKQIDGGFDYLLKINVSSFTEQKVIALKNELDSLLSQLDKVSNTTEMQMWETELMELKSELF